MSKPEHVKHEDTEAVVAQWRPWIIRKAGEILGPKQSHLHDDAVQEAMIGMWIRLEEGMPVPIALFKAKQQILDVARGRRMMGSAGAETHGKVDFHRRATSLVRTNSLGEEYELEPADGGASSAYDAVDNQDALEQALGLLSEPQARAVRRMYLDGMTSVECGELEGVSGAAIRSRVKKALAVMREHLDDAA